MLLQTSPFSLQIDTLTGPSFISGLEGDYIIAGHLVNVKKIDNCHYIFSNETTTISIETLPIHQNVGVGSSFWLSSLAAFGILPHNKNIIKNQRVLELGSGVGLGGISVFCNRAASITLSDISDFLPILRKNSSSLGYSRTSHYTLDWTNCSSDSYNSSTIGGPFDVILACDCVYRDTRHILKNAIVKNLMNIGTAIIINPKRDGLDDFLYSLQEHGTIILDTIPVIHKENIMYLEYILFTKVL